MIQTYLSFTINEENYAVNVAKVLEVLQNEHITPVPNAPAFIRGILNFRGEVVPVFDTRIRFNLTGGKSSNYNIIVLDVSGENSALRLGAIVDKVDDVISLHDEEIKQVPAMSSDYNTDFLHGIYKQGKSFTMVLNVEKVFTAKELSAIKDSNIN
jgi:purine-binding chemotaxis protein CheW